MELSLHFHKGENKPSTLTCIRGDGSSTWTKLKPGMEPHDLAHYVVETELGFTGAFYGLLDMGYEISDFELPRDRRPEALIPANLPVESLQTEHIVNLLQIEYFNSGEDPEFLNTLASTLREAGLPFPEQLTEQRLKSIRDTYRQLVFSWHSLPADGLLKLKIKGAG